MNVLIVDNEPMMLEMAEDIVKEAIPDVTVMSALEAFELYASGISMRLIRQNWTEADPDRGG